MPGRRDTLIRALVIALAVMLLLSFTLPFILTGR